MVVIRFLYLVTRRTLGRSQNGIFCVKPIVCGASDISSAPKRGLSPPKFSFGKSAVPTPAPAPPPV